MMVNDSPPAILGRRWSIRYRSMALRTAFVARIVVVACEQRQSGVGCVSALEVVRERERRDLSHAAPPFVGGGAQPVSQPTAAEPMPSITLLWAFDDRKARLFSQFPW